MHKTKKSMLIFKYWLNY